MASPKVVIHQNLLSELKSRFPGVPDEVIQSLMNQNRNDRQKCIEDLVLESPICLQEPAQEQVDVAIHAAHASEEDQQSLSPINPLKLEDAALTGSCDNIYNNTDYKLKNYCQHFPQQEGMQHGLSLPSPFIVTHHQNAIQTLEVGKNFVSNIGKKFSSDGSTSTYDQHTSPCVFDSVYQMSPSETDMPQHLQTYTVHSETAKHRPCLLSLAAARSANGSDQLLAVQLADQTELCTSPMQISPMQFSNSFCEENQNANGTPGALCDTVCSFSTSETVDPYIQSKQIYQSQGGMCNYASTQNQHAPSPVTSTSNHTHRSHAYIHMGSSTTNPLQASTLLNSPTSCLHVSENTAQHPNDLSEGPYRMMQQIYGADVPQQYQHQLQQFISLDTPKPAELLNLKEYETQEPMKQVISPDSSQGSLHGVDMTNSDQPLECSIVRFEDIAYTQALLLHQRARMEKLKKDLEEGQKLLNLMKVSVAEKEKELAQRRQHRTQNFSNGSSYTEQMQLLRDAIRILQIDIQIMTRDIDMCGKSHAPLGITDPNEEQAFYSHIGPGQHGSVYTQEGHQSDLRPAGPVGSNSAHELDNDGDQWNCSACTFLNHPTLDKCEMCEMPRVTFGTSD